MDFKRKYELVVGTHVYVPMHLLRFKQLYRIVGKNLFILTAPDESLTLKELKASKLNLRKLAFTEESQVTLGEIVARLVAKPKYLKCTEKQTKDYWEAKLRYDSFITKAQNQAKERRKKLDLVEISKAKKVLEKHKVSVTYTDM